MQTEPLQIIENCETDQLITLEQPDQLITFDELDSSPPQQLNQLISRSLSLVINFKGNSEQDPVDQKLSLELLEELQESLRDVEKDRQRLRQENESLTKQLQASQLESSDLKQQLELLQLQLSNNRPLPPAPPTVQPPPTPPTFTTADHNDAGTVHSIQTLATANGNGTSGNASHDQRSLSPSSTTLSDDLNKTNLEASLTEAHREIRDLKDRLRRVSGNSAPSPTTLSRDRGLTPPKYQRSSSSTAINFTHSPGTEAERKTQLIGKQFSSLLSKVASDIRVLESVQEVVSRPPIDTIERLDLVVHLLFDKAIAESWDIDRYVNLCLRLRHLSIYKANENTGEKELVRFQKLLLGRCKREFDSDPYQELGLDHRQALIDEIGRQDAEHAQKLQLELIEDKRQAMRRKLGNIKLVGQLYMNSVGDGTLVVHCLRKLAHDLTEDTLELLCVLIRTVGQRLEKDYKVRGKFKDLEPFFKRLHQIVRDTSTSERVKFFVQDILNLRANQWNDPRTLNLQSVQASPRYSNVGRYLSTRQNSSPAANGSNSSALGRSLGRSNANFSSTLSLPFS